MFCSECGAKNEKDARFCSECGFKFEEEKKVVKKEIKKVETSEVKSAEPSTTKKKSNTKTIIIIILIAALIGGYKILSDMTGPSEVAKNYIEAVVNNNTDKLYDYLEIKGDKTFVSKKLFKKIYTKNYKSKISNYSIGKTEYGKGKLTATVNFNYTVKGSSKEQNGSVKLSKSKEKTYFIFDTWKINDLNDSSSLVVKDYKISVLKGSKLEFGDIKVSSKYLSKKESNSNTDVYVLPQVFTIKTNIKVELPNGLEIEKEVTPSSWYNSYTVSFSADDLSKKQKKEIVNSAKEIISDLYSSAIKGKKFDEIKSSYKRSGLDLTNLEKNYNKFLDDLSNGYYKLTKFTITDISIYSIRSNDEGNLEAEFKVIYDYTVEYKSGDETKTKDRTNNSAWMTIILGMDEDEYYLTNFKTLKTYFY